MAELRDLPPHPQLVQLSSQVHQAVRRDDGHLSKKYLLTNKIFAVKKVCHKKYLGVPKIFDVHKYFVGKKWFQYACTTYQHELGEGVRGPGAAVRPLVVVSLPVRGVLHEAAPPGLNRGKYYFQTVVI